MPEMKTVATIPGVGHDFPVTQVSLYKDILLAEFDDSRPTDEKDDGEVNENDLKYPRFAYQINEKYPDYKWEPFTVTTSDGYILTMFKMWNNSETLQTKRE